MALSLDFTGKHVFVFGGTTGIGFGIARNFSTHGANVSIASRKQANIDAAMAALEPTGNNVLGVVADVRDCTPSSVPYRAPQASFTVDVLVSGAAGNFLAAVNAQSSNGFRAVVNIDLIGTFNVMRATYPHLTKPGAASSISPRPSHSARCATRPAPVLPRLGSIS